MLSQDEARAILRPAAEAAGMTSLGDMISAELLVHLVCDWRVQNGPIGGRVHLVPPAEPGFPYLQVGRTHVAVDGDETGALALTVVSSAGREEAQRLLATLREDLYGVVLELADGRLAALRVTYADVFGAPDHRTTRGVLRLRAAVSPFEARAAA